MTEELLVTEVEGPRGTAEIFEIAVPHGRVIEVEYAVVFESERKVLPSLGEAHILANHLTGVDEDN